MKKILRVKKLTEAITDIYKGEKATVDKIDHRVAAAIRAAEQARQAAALARDQGDTATADELEARADELERWADIENNAFRHDQRDFSEGDGGDPGGNAQSKPWEGPGDPNNNKNKDNDNPFNVQPRNNSPRPTGHGKSGAQGGPQGQGGQSGNEQQNGQGNGQEQSNGQGDQPGQNGQPNVNGQSGSQNGTSRPGSQSGGQGQAGNQQGGQRSGRGGSPGQPPIQQGNGSNQGQSGSGSQSGQSGNQGQQGGQGQNGQQGGQQGNQAGQNGQSGNQGQQGQNGQSGNQGQQGQNGQSGNQGQQGNSQENQNGDQGQANQQDGQQNNQQDTQGQQQKPKQEDEDEFERMKKVLRSLRGGEQAGAKQSLSDILADMPKNESFYLNEALFEPITKDITAISDDEFDDIIASTINAISTVKPVKITPPMSDRIRQIKQDMDDLNTIAEINADNATHTAEERAKQKAAKAALAKIAAKEKGGNTEEFKQMLRLAIKNQIAVAERENDSWARFNRRHQSDGIIQPGAVRSPYRAKKAITMSVFLDCSSSFNSSDIQKEVAFLSVISEFTDEKKARERNRPVVKVALYCFADNLHAVYGDVLSTFASIRQKESCTDAWPQIIDEIQNTKPDNILIITDHDMNGACESNGGKYTAKGCAWYIWKRLDAPELPNHVKGMRGTYEYWL